METLVIRFNRANIPGANNRPGFSQRARIEIVRVSESTLESTAYTDALNFLSDVPEMEGKKVWMLRNGKAHSTVIETGQRTENKIEVISGLSVGDTILVTGLMQVKEGAAVKPETVE